MDLVECLAEVSEFHGGTLSKPPRKSCDTCGLTDEQVADGGCNGCTDKYENWVKKPKARRSVVRRR